MLNGNAIKKKVTFEGKEHVPTYDKKVENKWQVGKCISIDDIGPISPLSLEGYSGFFYIKDLASRKVFSYLVKSCNSESYLEALEHVRQYFKGKDSKLTTVQTITTV